MENLPTFCLTTFSMLSVKEKAITFQEKIDLVLVTATVNT